MGMLKQFGVFAVAVLAAWAQPGAEVTATKRIRIDGKLQTVRQINGRWWSHDNRELIQTSSNFRWTISGGNARHLVRFDRHHPVDPARVNSVDRSMGPDAVRAVLGPPNSVFPSDKPETVQQWNYYGAAAYKLSIKFSSSGGIFTAHYQPDAKTMPIDVPHLVFRIDGKSANERFSERAAPVPARNPSETLEQQHRKLRDEIAARRSGRAPSSSTLTVIDPAPAAPPPAPGRKVSPEELAQVTLGMQKAKLLEFLGNPASRMSIAGSEDTQEFLTYEKLDGAKVTIVLQAGKVSRLP